MTIMLAFSSELKAARERAGLSQIGLAEKAQIDNTLISRYENGERLPSRQRIQELTDALQCGTILFLAAGLIPDYQDIVSKPD